MSQDHEATVRSFFEAWTARDPDTLTAFFAEDGAWRESNRAPARGHAALREMFVLQTSFATDFSFEFRKLAAVGDTVFTERIDRFSLNGTPMTVTVAGVFELGPDGRFTEWRDYYNWPDLEHQLMAAGVDLSGMDHG